MTMRFVETTHMRELLQVFSHLDDAAQRRVIDYARQQIPVPRKRTPEQDAAALFSEEDTKVMFDALAKMDEYDLLWEARQETVDIFEREAYKNGVSTLDLRLIRRAVEKKHQWHFIDYAWLDFD